AFAALFADRRGDILAAQGKRDEARAAWQQAIDGLGTNNPLTQVVQLKLDALTGA
ncbi:tetratricopeptide repeat protein, partial [Bordetella hinzii]|nr:tetratricopeptide repeat protein [Bordetella hinzii]